MVQHSIHVKHGVDSNLSIDVPLRVSSHNFCHTCTYMLLSEATVLNIHRAQTRSGKPSYVPWCQVRAEPINLESRWCTVFVSLFGKLAVHIHSSRALVHTIITIIIYIFAIFASQIRNTNQTHKYSTRPRNSRQM